MAIFAEFLLRLSFGLAVGMAITSPRLVSSGYFRNHLYVTLGLATLACLICLSAGFTWWAALAAAMASYVGSVCWLYESPMSGKLMLWLTAVFSLTAMWQVPLVGEPSSSSESLEVLHLLGSMTSGLVLGVTTAAMLLGHWYLNSPGMKMAPLRKLLVIAFAAVVLHALLGIYGLAGHWQVALGFSTVDWLFLCLRWVFGIFGTLLLIGMAWQTLRIPNTQSATGILYVAVIAVFTGELTALLLSAQAEFLL